MKLIGCGSRDTKGLTAAQLKGLISLHGSGRFTELIVGSDRGADRVLRLWAAMAGIETVVFFPNFVGQGKPAGPQRNTKQLAYLLWQCDRTRETPGCLVLPGGKGTADMTRQARAAGCYMMLWHEADSVFRLEGINP
jgi:hypothetical protein